MNTKMLKSRISTPKKMALSLFIVGGLLASCSSDDDGPTGQETVAPSTYEFTRDGSTSVRYKGQTSRLLMGGELGSALKDNTKTEAQLDGMFTNTGNQFSSDDLNTSGKDIRSKTAASTDYFVANTTQAGVIKADFDGWIASQVSDVFPFWSDNASAGVAGQIQEAGGGSIRYVNAQGLEYDQVIIKGLIGALTADQILNNYLSPAVLDAGDNRMNNDAGVLDDDNNFTTMEHKWDEAFGYLYGNDNASAPQLGTDSFLNKYLSKVVSDSDFEDFGTVIYDAFKLGRAAIVAKDYGVRDDQAEIIRGKISEIIGIRSVYYLQQGKNNYASDLGGAFHDLSEGFGFIYSLQFTREPDTSTPYFTKAEVDAFIATLLEGDGLWDVTPETLDAISEQIADRFNFTVEQAGS